MTDAEDVRYSRHIGLPGIGMQGQQKLEAATVLVIGLGGLGSAASLYLANSGVGRLLINDFDRVDATNLPRQILFDPDDLGAKPGQHPGSFRVDAIPAKVNDAHVTERPIFDDIALC